MGRGRRRRDFAERVFKKGRCQESIDREGGWKLGVGDGGASN